MISRRSVQELTVPINSVGKPELAVTTGETSEAASRDDTELIALLHHRDSGHLDVLFDRYSRLVLGTASHVLGDPSEAEEVVQEVFLYLYRKSGLFDPSKGSLKAWISRITFSRAPDRKLYLARRRYYAGADIGSVELPGKTDLEQEIETKLNRKQLESAFAELTGMQRQTIELFYFEGLGLREIGQQLRQPLGRVRHHLYRGLERLRRSPLLNRLRRNR